MLSQVVNPANNPAILPDLSQCGTRVMINRLTVMLLLKLDTMISPHKSTLSCIQELQFNFRTTNEVVLDDVLVLL